ncbi:MAG: hypothetical protein M0R46_06590 [Candidatus Muirbacterium halophilum]|nr:hypothetical protein [Candidatus Muirbacterium halophilum]
MNLKIINIENVSNVDTIIIDNEIIKYIVVKVVDTIDKDSISMTKTEIVE